MCHDLGAAGPRCESAKRFILRCDRCTMELLRKRRPPADVSCERCSRRSDDARFPMRVLEIVELREVEPVERAAQRRRRRSNQML